MTTGRQPIESAFPFPLKVDATLPENVILAEGCSGVSYVEDGDTQLWMVGLDTWDAMTPEQRAEFGDPR